MRDLFSLERKDTVAIVGHLNRPTRKGATATQTEILVSERFLPKGLHKSRPRDLYDQGRMHTEASRSIKMMVPAGSQRGVGMLFPCHRNTLVAEPCQETNPMMNLIELLETRRKEIIDEATESLFRARLRHYQTSGMEQNRQRLETLYALTLECVKSKNLVPMLDYARTIARERYLNSYDLQEVQTAFNVLEEEIWKRITAVVAPADYPGAFGLTSTVLGAGKQALAAEYVALASHKKEVQPLDLNALFKVL
jgi:hypothetical protein